jgi:DNA topoisomerase IB
MLEFAEALPRLRRAVKRDLVRDELGRDRVLACAVRLLDLGMFRIGSEDYAERNQSYGLATIRKDHVTVDGARIEFDYPAKSNQRRVHWVEDALVLPVVTALKRRRGGSPELLAYRDGRRWHDVTSTDINDYVKGVTGGEFSAKDFRTWNGTVLAAVAVAGEVPKSKTARTRRVNDAVKGVAFFLGNTPAVCRASYIDPRVFDRFDGGLTIGGALPELVEDTGPWPDVQRAVEEAVLDLIADNRESDLVEEGVELAAVA